MPECACGTGLLTADITALSYPEMVFDAVGKAGADFKRQFTESSYKDFFTENGFDDVTVVPIHGRIPCAVAVITKEGQSCF